MMKSSNLFYDNISWLILIYSWALNNLWFTNFPLIQEGNLQCRYLILPHNSKYDAGLSNRFGLEQSQPLIVKPIKGNFKFTPFLTIQGNNCIVVSIIKADRLGVVKIRLRSVSNKNELIKLDWHGHNPTSLYIPDFDQKPEVKAIINNEVLVPAIGFERLMQNGSETIYVEIQPMMKRVIQNKGFY